MVTQTLIEKSLLVEGWSKGLGGGIGSSLMYEPVGGIVALVDTPANAGSELDWPSDSGELGLILGLMTGAGTPEAEPTCCSACNGSTSGTSPPPPPPLSALLPLACFRILCRMSSPMHSCHRRCCCCWFSLRKLSAKFKLKYRNLVMFAVDGVHRWSSQRVFSRYYAGWLLSKKREIWGKNESQLVNVCGNIYFFVVTDWLTSEGNTHSDDKLHDTNTWRRSTCQNEEEEQQQDQSPISLVVSGVAIRQLDTDTLPLDFKLFRLPAFNYVLRHNWVSRVGGGGGVSRWC